MGVGCPKQIAGQDPVDWNVPRPEVVHEFRWALKKAKDERPLQTFFEKNPVALLTGILKPHEAWVFPRPRLPLPGPGGVVPDFIICEWSSIGPAWTIVELESPTKSPITKCGKSRICDHAIEQITHCKIYLRDYAEYMRNAGWTGIHGNCEGVIVIGRREDRGRSQQSEYLQACREQHIEIMSYDRLLESCEEMQRHNAGVRLRIAEAKLRNGTDI
jgi:hypothetical protein